MKVMTSDHIRKADAYTIENEPIASIDLMERAAVNCFDWIVENFNLDGSCCHVFCGVGNNGGDGLVLARLLSEKGIRVKVYTVLFSENKSTDYSINFERLLGTNVEVQELTQAEFDFHYGPKDLIIDAIFGNGLTRNVSGWLKEVIQQINVIPLMKLSIDLPSGLFSEYNHENDMEAVVKADVTLTFQNPKLAMLLEESGVFCGDWEVLDIGLDQYFIDSLASTFHVISEDDVWIRLKEREKFDHKGSFGHALIVAGSKGKAGACVLSSKACLKSGIGLLTLYVPECALDVLQISVPEAMCLTSSSQDEISDIPSDLSAFNALGVGPGMGLSDLTKQGLKQLLAKWHGALVLDADALNIIADDLSLLSKVPPNTILTPHPGEFKRLVGAWDTEKEKIEKLIEFSTKNKVVTVLKGGHTAVCNAEGEVYFNSSGNPGMATAGSGDVLLGMITGLLGRGYEAMDAAMVGVYLHGVAGDLASFEYGEESMTSMDVVNNIPSAFKNIS